MNTHVARSLGVLGLFAASCIVSHVTAQRGETQRGEAAQRGDPAQAEQAAPNDDARLSGTWQLTQPESEANGTIQSEIERAVAQMPFLTRTFGRNRLRATNPAPRQIAVQIEGQQLSVAFDQDARYQAREGQWTQVNARGEQSRLVMQRRPDRLYLTFRSDNGQKRMVLTTSQDGNHMWLDVDVTSPRLPSPVSYRLPYRRAR